MTRGFLSDGEVQRSTLCDIAAEVRRETDKAWLIHDGLRRSLSKADQILNGTPP